MSKEPWGQMYPRFKVLITIGFAGTLYLATRSDAEPMAPLMGLLLIVVFGLLFFLRSSESSVDLVNPHRGLQQMNNRRSLMWLIAVLLIPVVLMVANGLQGLSSGRRPWP